MWHENDPSLLRDRRCWAKAYNLQSIAVMVASSYDRNVFKLDVKQTKKQNVIFFIKENVVKTSTCIN